MKFKDLPKNDNAGESLPFLKIKDGENIQAVFKGDPVEMYQIWETRQTYPYHPDRRPKGATFRFRINVIVKEGASYVAKVWEQGTTVYNILRGLSESGYELDSNLFTIMRRGATKDDTVYTILPAPPSKQPGEATWKVINQTPLVELKAPTAPKGSPEPDFDAPPLDSYTSEGEALPF